MSTLVMGETEILTVAQLIKGSKPCKMCYEFCLLVHLSTSNYYKKKD